MKKIELMTGMIFLTGIILNLFSISGAGILLTIGGLIFGSIYFYLGIFIFLNVKPKDWFKRETYKTTSPQRIFGSIATGIALSFVSIGILFMYQSFPGSGIMIKVGGLPLIVILIISIVKFNKTNSKFYTRIITRIALAILFTVIYLVF